MRFVLRLLVLCFGLAALSPALAADDRLGVPGPITFAGERYDLAWASAPQPGYVKQEYLPGGQAVDRFEAMILVEFIEGQVTPADLVRAQTQTLEARREIDPLVNYEILVANDGDDIILDFLISGETEEGTQIAEWNAYRFVGGRDADGRAGGWLVGISRRAYGDAITSFLEGRRDGRGDDVAALAALSVPPRPEN